MTWPIDLNRVRNATHFARQHLREWMDAAERAFADLDRKERETVQECRRCFYVGRQRMAGQAFTERECENCKRSVMYPTTDTNSLCVECGQRLGLCVRCCADIDLVDRRKLERGKEKTR
jgi:hypothetical protein